MKSLEQGSQRIQKICDVIKEESLEPARKESEALIKEAKQRAHEIVEEGKAQKARLLAEARAEIEQERNVFNSSLEQASKQGVESLKQAIGKLFNEELHRYINQGSSDPKLVARIIEAIVKAIEKEGIVANLSAVIPQAVSTQEINTILGQNLLSKLQEKGVVIGGFSGGAQVKIQNKQMTIDITDSALQELLSSYVRKDFRKFFFGNGK